MAVKNPRIISVVYRAVDLDDDRDEKSGLLYRKSLSHFDEKHIGTGTFGTVIQCVLKETNETVAIKKVVQDKRYKVCYKIVAFSLLQNRELQVMKILDHPNCVKMKYFYFETNKVLFPFFLCNCVLVWTDLFTYGNGIPSSDSLFCNSLF
jgi:serine/threonine protein kinase